MSFLPFATKLVESFVGENEHWSLVSNFTDLLMQLTLMHNTRPYDSLRAAGISQMWHCCSVVWRWRLLSVGEGTRWRTKPKVHLMEELIEYQTVEHCSPCEYWTYKDESWGMWLSHVTARRGGKNTAWGRALSSLVHLDTCCTNWIVHEQPT